MAARAQHARQTKAKPGRARAKTSQLNQFFRSPKGILLVLWTVLSIAWLWSVHDFAYRNTSDLGFHLYNLKQLDATGGPIANSFYNGDWFWGQEYLVAYSPGTAIIGSLFSWMLPGIAGSILAYKIMVLIFTLIALFGMAALMRRWTADSRIIVSAAALYAYSPFIWNALIHSLPDFTAYALMPVVLTLGLAWRERLATNDAFWHKWTRPAAICAAIAFVTVFSIQVMLSVIVAFHTALAYIIIEIVLGVSDCRRKRGKAFIVLRDAVLRIIKLAAGALLLTAYWTLPFISYLLSPTYGGNKLSLTGGALTRYVHDIFANITVNAFKRDIIGLASPLARHAVPLLFGIIALLLLIPLIRKYARAQTQVSNAKSTEGEHGLSILTWLASIALLLGIFAFFTNIVSFGLIILEEHARWFDVANLALSGLAAFAIVALFDTVKSRAAKIIVSAGFVLLVIGIVWAALTPHTTVNVREELNRQQPVFAFIQNDTSDSDATHAYRVLELPFLYMPYTSLEHGKPLVFGSCESCNRNAKIDTMAVFEPLLARTDGSSDIAAEAQAIPAASIAPFTAMLNAKYIIVYDVRSYPALNTTFSYAAVPVLDRAPGLSRAFVSSTSDVETAWTIAPRLQGMRVEGNSLTGNFDTADARNMRIALCSIGALAPQYITSVCNSTSYRITFNIQIYAMPDATTGSESLLLPQGISPVADELLGKARMLNALNPIIHISDGTKLSVMHTTIVYRNMLVRPRIEAVSRSIPLPMDQRDANSGFEAYANMTLAKGGPLLDTTAAYGTNVPDARYSPGVITGGAHSNTQYKFLITSTSNQLVLVHEGHSPYWHATIDGKSAEVLEAQPSLLAVQVPSGTHRVELHYDGSPLARIGGAITILVLIGFVAIYFLAALKR